MEFTGERFVPIKELMNDEIAFEHLHRYYNALKLVKGKIVLDIACGEGYGTKILSKNANKVFGVDIDSASIDHAKKTYRENNIEFICGSVKNIPLADNSVDVVVSFETIEHIDEETQNNFLAEIKRVLKKGGALIISTPDKANYTDRYSHKNEFHIKEFGKDEFISFLKNRFKQVSAFLQGYEIVDAITEQSLAAINELSVIKLQDSFRPFSRKYIIALCSDGEIETRHFSSVVFQVSKDYLDLMDGIVSKEAHILELGNWGRSLDREIEEKNSIINNQRQKIEEQSVLETEKKAWQASEIYFKDLLYKQTVIIENLSTFEKERRRLIEEKKIQDEEMSLLKESYRFAENKIAENNKVVLSQSETITLLKSNIEQHSRKIQLLEQEKNDKDLLLKQQKEQEQSLHLQWEDLYGKWSNLNNRLSEIYNSEGWKFLNIYYKIKGKVIPENSKRYEYL
ncbi:MAG: methyltransferase domain-containing protein, partial [Bacteroidota bacterium]